MDEIKVGQIWRDNDKRSRDRLLRVESVWGGFAYCLVSRNGGAWIGKTRIAVERMRPTSTGYVLEKDA